jgi:hypothetical protein
MDPKETQKILLETASQLRGLMGNLESNVNLGLEQIENEEQKKFILDSLTQAKEGKLDINNFINELNKK